MNDMADLEHTNEIDERIKWMTEGIEKPNEYKM
jgi:hypothetical protein